MPIALMQLVISNQARAQTETEQCTSIIIIIIIAIVVPCIVRDYPRRELGCVAVGCV